MWKINFVLGAVFLATALAAPSSNNVEDEGQELDGRIVNGHEARFGENQAIASIQLDTSGFGRSQSILENRGLKAVPVAASRGFHFCGGVLLDKRWVMTAAHCSVTQEAEALRVVLGALDLNDRSNPSYKVKQIIVHKYDDVSKRGDLALFEIEPHDMDENERKSHPIKPIELAPPEFDPTERMCKASGWGHLSAKGGTTTKLREVEVKVLHQDMCDTMFKRLGNYPWDRETDSMICAGGKDRDACQGDSGGPFVCTNDDGVELLTGLVSWGVGCATQGVPGVYTNIRKYHQWIKDVMRDGKCTYDCYEE